MPLRLLIANRGEIALRIIRTCRKLQIETVLVYSDADRDSLPLAYADSTFSLTGVTPFETYLNKPKIIKAALQTKSDGIHPGYGFLSEDASFAKACEENGLVFVGPSSNSIAKLENKLTARSTMKEAGIPIIPGCDSPLENEEDAVQMAEKIEYPVILKAAYGGGGRGMRVAGTANEVRRFFRVTRMEATSSFGKNEIYIEKQLIRPRHVEIQAIANKGRIITLGERECSIQRRHQKLLEEAPSIGINNSTRNALSQAAKKGLEASDYTNAGTVEFLVEDTGNFYFLEVNKRLQVEHLVTELTTNIDLVEEQLSVAFNSEMNLSQNEINVKGWAINCRINAEDPRRDFAPSPGKVIHYHPSAGPGIRIDSALFSGHIVPEYYDSLILKLASYGRNRMDAINRMSGALDELEIIGIPTTIPLHKAIIYDDKFTCGQFDTAFLDDFTPKLRDELAHIEENAAALATASRILTPHQNKVQMRSKSNWRRSGPVYMHRGSGW